MSLGKEIEAIEMERGLAGMQEHMCKEKFKDIRQRILDGERSDDPVKDFMIVAYSGELKGGHEVLVEQGIKNLQEKIKENQGQQVLVIVDEEKIGGCTGLGGKGYVDLTEIRVLGVINGELNFSYEPRTAFIDLSARCGIGDIVIPTNGYVTFGDYRRKNGGIRLRDGDILVSHEYVKGIGKKIYRRAGEEWGNGFNSQCVLNIIIGSDAIMRYFKFSRKHLDDFGDETEKMLEHMPKIEGHEYEINDLRYAEALELLGQEIHEGFKEKYETVKKKEECDLLDALFTFALYGQKHSDAEMVKRGLAKAFTKDWHKQDKIINKGPGLTMSVKDTVLGLCDTYNIDVPE